MNPTIAAQANQAAQQGQQLLGQDQNQASTATGQYNNYSNQANQANQQSQNEAKYMQGAGSGQSVYNANQGQQFAKAGYSAANQNAATANLYKLNGELNGANQQFNTPGAVGGFGAMSSGALGGYENSVLSGLQTGMNNANTQVGQGNTAYANASNATAALTSNQVQSEQGALTGFNNAAAGFQNQAATAQSNMQFFNKLASTQGSLNAQEAQNYAGAQQAYAQAQNALAQIKLYQAQGNSANAQAGLYGAETPGAAAVSTGQVNNYNQTVAKQKAAQAQAQQNQWNQYIKQNNMHNVGSSGQPIYAANF